MPPSTEHRTHIDVMTRWICDAEILRAIAKISFNYLALWEGQTIALSEKFNTIRQFIRYGESPGYQLVFPTTDPILEDESVGRNRRLGHILTLTTALDRVSIMSQITLFNNITYRVALAPKYYDFANKLPSRGHFFNLADMTIVELNSKKIISLQKEMKYLFSPSTCPKWLQSFCIFSFFPKESKQ